MNKDLVITVIASAVVIGIFSGLIISLNNSQMVNKPAGGRDDTANGAGQGVGQVTNKIPNWADFHMTKYYYSWTDRDGNKISFTVYGALNNTGADNRFQLFLIGPVDDPDERHQSVNTTLASPIFPLLPNEQVSIINYPFELTKDNLPTDGEYMFQAKYMGVNSHQIKFFVDGRK